MPVRYPRFVIVTCPALIARTSPRIASKSGEHDIAGPRTSYDSALPVSAGIGWTATAIGASYVQGTVAVATLSERAGGAGRGARCRRQRAQ
jgi:hypothetical protein